MRGVQACWGEALRRIGTQRGTGDTDVLRLMTERRRTNREFRGSRSRVAQILLRPTMRMQLRGPNEGNAVLGGRSS